MNGNSLYKEKIDGFLNIIRDVGLYQHWTTGAFTDALKYNQRDFIELCPHYRNINVYNFTKKIKFDDIPRIQALNVDFFSYLLLEFAIGLIPPLADFSMSDGNSRFVARFVPASYT
uniref:Uncharacterized protein n=1 Tax=Megaselia scalaris TaxID=36166 RepID=T1GYS6_MEGSC